MLRNEFFEGLTSDTLTNMLTYSESNNVFTDEGNEIIRNILESRKERLK